MEVSFIQIFTSLGIDKIEREKVKLISKIETAEKEIQKINDGKTTINNIFKTQLGKQNRISELHTFVARSKIIVQTYK